MKKSIQRFAAIDLGTNTLNILITEKVKGNLIPVFEHSKIIRFGEGIAETGNISLSAEKRCQKGFKFVHSKLNEYDVGKILCTATSALRDAENGQKIKENLINKFDIPIKIISGEEEADLVMEATKNEFDLSNLKAVLFDIGGGSTEISLIENETCQYKKSFKIGTVTWTEKFISKDPPVHDEIKALHTDITKKLSEIISTQADIGIGIAGTVTTLCAIINGIEPYNSDKIHRSMLSYTDINSCEKLLINCDLDTRKKIKGLNPERAAVIPAGAVITRTICETFGLKKIYVSDKGLRWGVMHKLVES